MAVFTPPQLFGRGLILVGYLADADGSYTQNVDNCSWTHIDDTSIYLYKHTDDGKTYPGLKTLIQQVSKAGICIEVFTQKKDVMITWPGPISSVDIY